MNLELNDVMPHLAGPYGVIAILFIGIVGILSVAVPALGFYLTDTRKKLKACNEKHESTLVDIGNLKMEMGELRGTIKEIHSTKTAIKELEKNILRELERRGR